MHRSKYFSKTMNRILVLNMCIVFVGMSGCAPLKKKFTRKKKETRDQKFIPVLEPEDYAAKIYSPASIYNQAYSLWMVWQRDLLLGIERDGSIKNQKYVLGEVIEQMRKMNGLLVEEKRGGLEGIISSYQDIQREYEKPNAFRSKGVMTRKINSEGKKIRLQFSPRVLGEGSYLEGQKRNEE